eukprot:m.41298 g.41298  ORF g.41298 m.41298 type:complete len:559 (-) comp9752_c0_seq3:96-1772(-)
MGCCSSHNTIDNAYSQKSAKVLDDFNVKSANKSAINQEGKRKASKSKQRPKVKPIKAKSEKAQIGQPSCGLGHAMKEIPLSEAETRPYCDRCAVLPPDDTKGIWHICASGCNFWLCPPCYEGSKRAGGGPSGSLLLQIDITAEPKDDRDMKEWWKAVTVDDYALEPPLDMNNMGPLGLPYCPAVGVTTSMVEMADRGWRDSRAEFTFWSTSPTLNYVLFAIQLAHLSKQMKLVCLRLISRIEGAYAHDGHRSTEQVFTMLQEHADRLQSAISPLLIDYRDEHNLCKTLGSIGSEVQNEDTEGTNRITQATYVDWMFEQHRGVMKKALDYEEGCRLLLTVMAHLCQPLFDNALKTLGGDQGAWRLAPPKTRQRMANKSALDHKGLPQPRAGYNLDVCRGAISCETTDDQLAVWDELSKKFSILRVKNSFSNSSFEGLQQILVNILFCPSKNEHPLTYADIVNSEMLRDAIQSASKANPERDEKFFRRAAGILSQLVEEDPKFASTPIRLVCEVQLYLNFYLQARKRTHLYFKIIRANKLLQLKSDCSAYIDAKLEEAQQ